MNEQRRRFYLQRLGVECWVPRSRVVECVADVVQAQDGLCVAGATRSQEDLGVAGATRLQEDLCVAGATRSQGDLGVAGATRSQEDLCVAGATRLQGDLGVAGLDWAGLAARVRGCVACEVLAGARTQTVFGVGDVRGPWLFVGEAPGADEDRLGEPFVGRAGKLLDSMLAALGLKRGEGVYIANILKCRPPQNRDPLPAEAAACRGFLDRQIALVQPRVIVALGRVAAQNLLSSEIPIGKMRGQRFVYQGIPVVVTYHPAYLLRSPQEKAKAWADLKLARQVFQAG